MKLHVYETRVYEVEVEDPKDGFEIAAALQGCVMATITYWECPQHDDHIFDVDDWRVLPDENDIGWQGKVAHCPYDGRELRLVTARILTISELMNDRREKNGEY